MDMPKYIKLANENIDTCEFFEMTWGELYLFGKDRVEKRDAELRKECSSWRYHGFDIYTIHDRVGTIIYTGKSRNRSANRLLDHRGFGDKTGHGKPTSTIGKYLAENKDSRNWKVRIYDLPQDFEQMAIFRHNGFFNDDHKPRKPSIAPTPMPSQKIIDEANTKRQQKMNSTLKF